VGVVVVGVVVVVVVAQEDFYLSPDLRMSELRKSGSHVGVRSADSNSGYEYT
jgi:hypothetical protein